MTEPKFDLFDFEFTETVCLPDIVLLCTRGRPKATTKKPVAANLDGLDDLDAVEDVELDTIWSAVHQTDLQL